MLLDLMWEPKKKPSLIFNMHMIIADLQAPHLAEPFVIREDRVRNVTDTTKVLVTAS